MNTPSKLSSHSLIPDVSAGDGSSFETSAQLSNFWTHVEPGDAESCLSSGNLQIYPQLCWLPLPVHHRRGPAAVNLSNLQPAGPLIPCTTCLQRPASLAASPFCTNLCPSSVLLAIQACLPVLLIPKPFWFGLSLSAYFEYIDLYNNKKKKQFFNTVP